MNERCRIYESIGEEGVREKEMVVMTKGVAEEKGGEVEVGQCTPVTTCPIRSEAFVKLPHINM